MILETCDLWDIWSEWSIYLPLKQPLGAITGTCDIWDTDYNTNNWEPGFMTIFVTRQLWVHLRVHSTAFVILAMFIWRIQEGLCQHIFGDISSLFFVQGDILFCAGWYAGRCWSCRTRTLSWDCRSISSPSLSPSTSSIIITSTIIKIVIAMLIKIS